MKDYNLDQEEIELLDSIESGEWESIDNVKEGLPYQTLMSSVLHKFITGRLIDKQAG